MNYTSLSQTVRNMLTNLGQTVTLTKLSGGTFDGVLGAFTGQSTTDYLVKAVISEYNDKLIDGSMIKVGDKKATLESTTEPAIDDVISVGGIDHKVINVKSYNPSGTVIAYEVQIRV